MTTNNRFKSFTKLSLVYMGLTLIYTLMLVSFHADISILAFFFSAIYVAFTFYILGIQILKNTNGTHMVSLGRLVEFLPYILFISFIIRRAGDKGTPFWYDLITVLLWISIFVLSIIISRKLDIKRAQSMTEGWAVMPVEKQYKGAAKVLFEVGDWIYAIIWAIFSVMILQIFFVQLYAIPSESMVPTFLVKDRVLVSKIDCGPKFPLTDVGLPTFRHYEKGDTVVLRNPHYSMDRKSEVKTVTSQLLYMLTFMTVNTNTDEYGQLKADPLVKRIVGEPGEQLVMQDGVLYIRTEDDNEFKPSEVDAKYATWNLNDYKKQFGNKIQNYVFSDDLYNQMLSFEEARRNYDLSYAKDRALYIASEVNKMVDDNLPISFDAPSLHIGKLFNNVSSIAQKIYTEDGGKEWFNDFITSWIPSIDNERDMYSESNYRLNVMSKITFAEIVYRYIRAYYNNEDFTRLGLDGAFMAQFENAEFLNLYIQALLDSRNMPVFPANDANGDASYLPKDCYFMMGDNRFNSLDLRHDSKRSLKPLTVDDPLSITYDSMMKPQYINKKYIIGKPILTFWPVNRFGKID